MEYESLFKAARQAGTLLAETETERLGRTLMHAAQLLRTHTPRLLEANARDLEAMAPDSPLRDRLRLTLERIAAIADDMEAVAHLPSPQGEELERRTRPNGMTIVKRRVPFGVVGMIYEARPNVTVDAFGLCFKTGNAVILKGGSDAIHSNIAIVSVIQKTLEQLGIPKEAASLIEDTSRDTAAAFMKMNQYVDVLIPRGGAGLIRVVVNQATIPVIETGTGNCHIFVDETADFDMAVNIIMNAKTQRIGVCNACESLVIHEKIVDTFMPKLTEALQKKNVELHADERSFAAAESDTALNRALIKPAVEEDWGKEYLDYMISAKTVASVDEAIEHINRYNTGHSEAIITENYTNAQKFLDEVDAACVYVNASTRFRVWLWCGDRYQYAEASCERSDGFRGIDKHEIYHLWKWSGKTIRKSNRNSEELTVL